MSERFQIIGPDGATYELTDVNAFLDEYEPQGFEIVKNPPADHIVPDVRERKRDRREAAKAEAEKKAEREAEAKRKADEDAAKQAAEDKAAAAKQAAEEKAKAEDKKDA